MGTDRLTRDKDVAWYRARPNEDQIGPEARQLLESYSNISPEDVEDHIVKVREEAWEVFPYPCIGQFRFLDLSLTHFQEYQEILQRLHDGQQLLDMACCFGQEIRQLVANGAPAENIHGCDIREEYITLGYKLFADKDTLQSKFLTADIFDVISPLSKFERLFDIIYTGSFFHLFDYQDQVRVGKAIAALLRPQKGSILLGRQVGSVNAGQEDHSTNPAGKMYRHNEESLKRMWDEIGKEIGVSFTVSARLEKLNQDHLKFHSDDTRRIWFTVTRN